MATAGLSQPAGRQTEGFLQAMLKTALETIPQFSEENYTVWKDKISAILEIRGLLNVLEDPNRSLFADDDAELRLLLLSKMDVTTHNNVVTDSIRGSAQALWNSIKERFASSESSNRARVFNLFLYLQFDENAVDEFFTETKVMMKKLIDVGIVLPEDVLAYLILFEFPETLQSLKRHIMHSDKDLNANFVLNHFVQYSNKHKAEKNEHHSEKALVKWNQPKSQRNAQNCCPTYARCTDGKHNPKLDRSRSAAECWQLNLNKAPDWLKESLQKKSSEASNVNYYLSLISLWINHRDLKSKLILDLGSSTHVFNDPKYFENLTLGEFNVLKTGKEAASMAVKGKGTVS